MYTIAEATEIFIRRTESDDIAAWAYLPTEYDHCGKCDTHETHEHPTKSAITAAEVATAITRFGRDEYESNHDI